MIEIDQKFKDYYNNNLKHVSLYLIDKCNLRCIQCFYKLELGFQVAKNEIDFSDAVNLITEFKKMGANILTLIGGEPTLYGIKENNKPLLDLIKIAKKELKYDYVRIDTNGQFDDKLLEKEEFKLLNEISFSLDGPNKEINDYIRGNSSFDKCINNIVKAKQLGYNVHVISCVSKELIKRDENGQSYIHHMIRLGEKLNIDKLDFHGLFKTGIPRDHYTGNIEIQVKDWINLKKEIDKKIKNGEYKISIKLPEIFKTKEQFEENINYYGYCSCKKPTRVFIQPNGLIRACPLMIGTPYSIAKFYNNKIIWEESYLNELLDHKMDKNTPCTNQYKNPKYGEYVPLCIYR